MTPMDDLTHDLGDGMEAILVDGKWILHDNAGILARHKDDDFVLSAKQAIRFARLVGGEL